ncbi:helix-turn-helix domain-containing protein [Micromonospora haikouensis]|uniref:helix-turn-helix domain-containing protein n=1 Tax=Micromonospora haikouensis TaxID=686309 RepID=UPI00343FAD8A
MQNLQDQKVRMMGAAMGDGDKPLRTSEAAERLNVSASTVIAWCKNGLLRTARTAGQHRRIEPGSVEELSRVLALPDGEREAAVEALRRRNLGEDTAPASS